MLRQQVDDLSYKVDQIRDLLLEGARLGNSVPSDDAHRHPAGGENVAGVAMDFIGKDWIARLAEQARELGLDISEEVVQRLGSTPSSLHGQAVEGEGSEQEGNDV